MRGGGIYEDSIDSIHVDERSINMESIYEEFNGDLQVLHDEGGGGVYNETWDHVHDEGRGGVYNETWDRVYDEGGRGVYNETWDRVYEEGRVGVYNETWDRVYDEGRGYQILDILLWILSLFEA